MQRQTTPDSGARNIRGMFPVRRLLPISLRMLLEPLPSTDSSYLVLPMQKRRQNFNRISNSPHCLCSESCRPRLHVLSTQQPCRSADPFGAEQISCAARVICRRADFSCKPMLNITFRFSRDASRCKPTLKESLLRGSCICNCCTMSPLHHSAVPEAPCQNLKGLQSCRNGRMKT